MYASRLARLLLAVSVLCVVHASLWNSPRLNRFGITRRQDGGGSDGLDATIPGADGLLGTSSKSDISTSSSPPPTSSSSPEPTVPPTSTPPPTTPPATTAPPPTSSSSEGGSSSSGPTPTPEPTLEPTSSPVDGGEAPSSTVVEAPISTEIEVITKTNSDGTKVTQTSTTKTTPTAGLNHGDGSKTSGMSKKTQSTVIGVVVGVGGAIVLGALALVAFRIWGRKKHLEESDGLMDYDSGVGTVEKSEPRSSGGGNQRNPFQSTLENYHQPTAVNASSNF